eukprot:CAMPEP_0169243774 /NCGR_PEP_ID=MMETSP1016-20121227/33275_1 /TAXON_ID=342587 /ORGANISM="Karlodinium micrum, Strain CCMP2283" /LENGTH=108 /DNA_ID=CAMNT_0009324099 /DNA_START=112 /DNA_END=438 /DNA_ORIENTATION=-
MSPLALLEEQSLTKMSSRPEQRMLSVQMSSSAVDSGGESADDKGELTCDIGCAALRDASRHAATSVAGAAVVELPEVSCENGCAALSDASCHADNKVAGGAVVEPRVS